MSMTEFEVTATDGASLTGRHWDIPAAARAVIELSHGAGEHLARYDRFACFLNAAGYAVIGVDHRGHGANALDGLGDFGPRGFGGVVADMATMAQFARRHYPGVPLVLFGHSMGSFAAQAFLARHADLIDGLILSGTAALDELLSNGDAGAGLAACNAAFEPARTPFDWLSRDLDEVDAYVADPLCGFDLALHSLATMPALVEGSRSRAGLATAAERQIPVMIVTGSCDPIVGPDQGFARRVEESYREAGLEHVDHRIYPGSRHELLNETNRDEVMRDIVAWLDRLTDSRRTDR